MKMYAVLNDESRLCSVASAEYREGSSVEIDFPDDFDINSHMEYRYVDGELVHDPEPIPPEVQIAQLKAKLSETDYVVVKLAEAQVAGVSMQSEDEERYRDIIEQRCGWRAEINELEGVSAVGRDDRDS